MDRSQVLKGLLDSVILGALRRGPAHGYALIRRLRTAGLTSVAEPSVYGTLRRLYRSGLLSSEVKESAGGPPRKVYSLNEEGSAQLSRSQETWLEVRDAVDRLVLAVEEE